MALYACRVHSLLQTWPSGGKLPPAKLAALAHICQVFQGAWHWSALVACSPQSHRRHAQTWRPDHQRPHARRLRCLGSARCCAQAPREFVRHALAVHTQKVTQIGVGANSATALRITLAWSTLACVVVSHVPFTMSDPAPARPARDPSMQGSSEGTSSLQGIRSSMV
jgi:hypothetical protein